MRRGTKPKPTAIRVLQGNPGKRPLPKREPRPPDAGVPEPPAALSEIARAEWITVAPVLHRMNLLSEIDRQALAAYCEACARWAVAQTAVNEMARGDPRTGGLLIKSPNGIVYENPLVGIARRAALDAVRFGAEFGMTPSSRTRLDVLPPPSEENPFAKLRREFESQRRSGRKSP
jgi:P27 family predicted phage terminase small subunit